MEEMKIQQKVFEMMEYAYVCLQQFPKSEKFALVVDIKRCMNLILERVVEGSKKYYKKTTLQELDVEVTKLKAYIRLSYKLGFLPIKKYEIWAEKVVEIGKMVGGWIKNVQRCLRYLIIFLNACKSYCRSSRLQMRSYTLMKLARICMW